MGNKDVFKDVSKDVSTFKHSGHPEITLEQVQLQFGVRNEMRNLLVENGKMYLLTLKHVYRINLSDPLSVSKVSWPGDSMDYSKVTNAWLEPSGNFLLVQVSSKDHYLLHSSYSNFKPLSRLKGLKIEYMIFGLSSDVSQRVDFICATKEGALYMASTKYHDPITQANKRDDKYVKQIYTSKKPLIGISYSRNSREIELHHADGKSVWNCQQISLNELIHTFRQTAEEQKNVDAQLPYRFYGSSSSYYCISETSGQIYSNDPEIAMSPKKVIGWEQHKARTGNQSLIATDHYLLYIASDSESLILVSKIMHQPPTVIPLAAVIGDELVLGVTSESTGQTRWLFTSKHVYELVISNESVSLWYSFFDMGEYDRALSMVEKDAKSSDVCTMKNIIYVKQAYELLQEGGFGLDFSGESSSDQAQRFTRLKKGIQLLSKSQEPFEKVTLMLLSSSSENRFHNSSTQQLLREYLLLKMKKFRNADTKLSNVVLSSWIVKIFLDSIHESDSFNSNASFAGSFLEESQNKEKCPTDLRGPLFSFLKENLHSLDSKAIYELMIHMGFEDELIDFAELLEDYEYIAYRHMENQSWLDAIQAMKKLSVKCGHKSTRVIADTSLRLLSKAPQATIKFWLSLDHLDFEKLLPTVLQFNKFHRELPYNQNPTIQFLSRLITEKGILSPLINNEYLSLLISYSSSSDETFISRDIMRTMDFLRNSIGFSKQKPYDADFLLRSCLHFRRIQPAISILVNDFKQFDTALCLALDEKSFFLGEFVLKFFDEYSKSMNDKSKNLLIKPEADTFHAQSINTRFDNDRLKYRKSLWYKYARFLIDGVCNDTDFELPKLAHNSRATPQRLNRMDMRSEVSHAEGASAEGKSPDTRSSRLSDVLKYLLTLSRIYGDSGDLLSFKDLVPMLPESALINHFREDIVESLHHYNNQINHLGFEMQESAAIASKLKSQVSDSNCASKQGQIYTIIEPGESCCLCRKILIQKNILVFQNCHHGCHKECAARFLLQSRVDYQFKKLFQNFKHFSDVAHKDDLDNFLRRACPLCNESNINSLDYEIVDEGNAGHSQWSMSHVTSSPA